MIVSGKLSFVPPTPSYCVRPAPAGATRPHDGKPLLELWLKDSGLATGQPDGASLSRVVTLLPQPFQ